MDDPVARSDALEREILAIPADRVFTKRVIAGAFVVLLVPTLVTLGIVARTTIDTNAAVRDQVEVLQRRNTELEQTNAELEDVNQQAVDHVVRLAEQVQSLGGDPGTIEIRPTTTTTEPGG